MHRSSPIFVVIFVRAPDFHFPDGIPGKNLGSIVAEEVHWVLNWPGSHVCIIINPVPYSSFSLIQKSSYAVMRDLRSLSGTPMRGHPEALEKTGFPAGNFGK